MSDIHSFEELEAWQKARRINDEIYQVSGTGAFQDDYALKNQIRRAAISVMSNIAEGFARESDQEFTRFLYISRSSCAEVQSQLYAALDQEYINEDEFQNLYDEVDQVSGKVMNLIKYLES